MGGEIASTRNEIPLGINQTAFVFIQHSYEISREYKTSKKKNDVFYTAILF
jgi:hypothetical protein